jgi:hypothetical protein
MNSTTPLGAGLLGLAVMAGSGAAYTGQEVAGMAKISIEQARAIAVKAHPGQIAHEELESRNHD